VAADANGNFNIGLIADRSPATLVFSSVGFETKEMTIDTSKTESQCNCRVGSNAIGYCWRIVVVGISRRKKKETIKLFQRIFKDSSYKFFRVYPNPVSAGSL
jgi:hypothetical protein